MNPEKNYFFGAEVIDCKDGVKILNMMNGSIAESNNFKRGDIIIEVDGVEIKNKEQYKLAIMKNVKSHKLFKIIRNQMVIKVEVSLK